MWKCIRCEKENPDSAENCMECGHGKTMNYRDYRTLAKVQSSVLEGWKKEQNTSEYFKKERYGIPPKDNRMFAKSKRKQQKHPVYDHCRIK